MSLFHRHALRIGAATLPLIVNHAARPALAPQHVTITANDYAFTAPSRVAAGLTTFHLVNHGKARHEVQIFRFAPNISTAAARKYLASNEIPDSVADLSGSVLIAAPGDSVRYGIQIDLKSGERYALLCEFRDAPNKPKHVTLGMFGLVEVVPATATSR